nr:LamG domain-containing protein [Allobranchiibius huperziae]
MTPPGYAARHASAPAAPRRRSRLVLVGLSVAAIATGAALPASASSSFTDTTVNAGDAWSAADYFSCANAVQAANPYFFYPLGEQSGNTATDASGGGRNGTYQPSRAGATSGTTAGPCGTDRATTLNGSSGYISTPTYLVGPNTFSLEIWFKTTTTRGGVLMGFSDAQTGAAKTAGDRVLYITNYGQLVFGVNPGRVAYVNTAGKVNDGTWHLATATLSNAGMRLYLDGQLADSDTTVTSGRSFNGYFRIGDNDLQGFPAAPTSNFLNASIYNAALFGSALTAAQVSAHYDAAS